MADFSKYGGKSKEWLKLESTLSNPPQEQSLAELIRLTNKGRESLSAQEMQVLAPYVQIKNYRIPTRYGAEIEARTYRPAKTELHELLPIFVYFHGGGFVFGTLDSEDAFCSRIIHADLDVVVVNVCYRHTPEHTYPTAWNDAEDAIEWIFDHAKGLGGIDEHIIVGGTSAGAYLSASLTLGQRLGFLLRGRPKLKGQLLMIPCLVQEPCYQEIKDMLQIPSMSSYEENEFAPILPLARMRLFNSLLKLPEAVNRSDWMLNPGLATPAELQGIPPTVLGIAGLDPLRDEALFFAQNLNDVGVPTKVTVFQGVPHGFRRFGDSLSLCKQWDSTVCRGLLWILNSPTTSVELECMEEDSSNPDA